MVITEQSAVVFGGRDFDAVFPFHIALDRAGIVTRVGSSLSKLAPHIRRGAPFATAFSPLRPDEPFDPTRLAAAAGRLYTIREQTTGTTLRGMVREIGSEIFFLGSPWLADTGELTRLGLSLDDFAAHDPTLDLLQALQIQRVASDDLQLLAARLRSQSVQLEEAARAKDAFLASMSHELRTPLTGILGVTESMLEGAGGSLTAAQERYLATVVKSGRRLLMLVNDLLDLVKITSGREQLERHHCPIGELCSAAMEAAERAAEQRGQRTSFQNELGNACIHVDARRFKQALDNLLENASKFTPRNGEFGLRAKEDEREFRFEVWDRGIGIAPQELPRLFTAFVQLDARLARRYDGTGLGLALVKILVELHGGRVDVASVVGEGSQFTIALPRSATLPP